MSADWSRIKISELCDLIVDCVNKTAPQVDYPTLYKMIRTSNIRFGKISLDSCRFVEKNIYEKWTRRAKVEIGDVLLTREAPMGEVGRVNYEDKTFLGQRVVQYRPNPNKLDSHFLLYSFLSPDLQYQFRRHNSNGSTVSHIRVPDCFEFEIRTPTIQHQKQISKVLSDLDSKIDLNNKINAELGAMTKLIYDYWFVQFDFPNAKGKPYKTSGGKMVWSEKLKREIPEGWEVRELGGILSLEYGKPLKEEDRSGFGYPVLGSNGIVGYHEQFLVEGSGIVVGRKGSAGEIVWVEENFYPIDTTFYVKDKLGIKDLYYHYLLLLKTSIKHVESSSAVPGLNRNFVYSFKLASPPTELIENFNRIVDPIFSKTKICNKESKKLSELRDWLLPMLMNGQVRIRDTEVSGDVDRPVEQVSFKPISPYFYQTQVIAAIIGASKEKKISHGEMTLAKYSYLLDKIYKVPTLFNYDRWHLGPYPKEMKKVVNNKKFFKIQNNEVSVVPQKKEYEFQFQQQVEDAVAELASIFNQYKGKERSHQTELLATVCKVVEGIQTTDLKAVRESMSKWPIALKGEKFKNKAEKFSEQETELIMSFMIKKGWDKLLTATMAA